MNERYLFRGKRTDNSKWEIGLLARYNPMYSCANIIGEMELLIPVDTKTVGQYIGRSDKNKKKIYEGDILLTDCWHTLLVVYFDEDYLQFRVREVVSGRENSIDYYDNSNNVKIEVVGNIYDNPEMLEVER